MLTNSKKFFVHAVLFTLYNNYRDRVSTCNSVAMKLQSYTLQYTVTHYVAM